MTQEDADQLLNIVCFLPSEREEGLELMAKVQQAVTRYKELQGTAAALCTLLQSELHDGDEILQSVTYKHLRRIV